MALKNLMARLQCRAADTPDTPEKNMGYQGKAPIHAGCTPDTPRFVDTRAIARIVQFVEAVNDLDSTEPGALENLQKPAMPVAKSDPAQAVGLVAEMPDSKSFKSVSTQTPVFTEPPEPPLDPNAWRELAAAYHLHHFKCSACIAAGRGAGHGLRCGTGAALWTSYQNT